MSDTEKGKQIYRNNWKWLKKSNKRDVLQIGINNVVLVRRGLASSRAGLLYVMQSAVNIYSLPTGRPVLAGTEDSWVIKSWKHILERQLFVSKCIII